MAGAVVLPTAAARTHGGALSACRFEVAGTGNVRAIIDGRSFTLEDGREIRLAGIEVPLPPASGESGPRAEAALAARAALESMLATLKRRAASKRGGRRPLRSRARHGLRHARRRCALGHA